MLGRGWRADRLDAPPTAAALDAVTGERPAALWAHDHHSLWLNGAALRATGIGRGTTTPAGGVVERDADGEPTGIVREHAAWDLPLPEPDARERRRAVEAAQRVAHARGITGVHDFERRHGFGLWQELHADRRLTLRVVAAQQAARPRRRPRHRPAHRLRRRPPAGRTRQGVPRRHPRLAHRDHARPLRRRRHRRRAAAARRARAPRAPRRGGRPRRGRPRDRRPRQPRRARRLRGDPRGLGAGRAAPPHRARADRRSDRRAALREGRGGGLHAAVPRPERPRCRGRRPRRARRDGLRLAHAARRRRRAGLRLRRADRGARRPGRGGRRRRAHARRAPAVAPRAGAHAARGPHRRSPPAQRGRPATSGAAVG